MKTLAMRRFAAAGLAVTVMTFAATDAGAGPDVMGCDVAQSPNNLKSCLDGKVNARVTQVQNEANQRLAEERRKFEEERKKAEDKVKEIENSSRYAKLNGEIEMLDAAKKLRLDQLFTCLERANNASRARIGANAARFANDPPGWVRASTEDAVGIVMADAATLFADDLARMGRGEKPPADVNVIFDSAWTKIEQVGQRHEGVGCLVSYVRPHLPSLKARTAEAARTVEAKSKEAWEKQIRPQFERALAATLTKSAGVIGGPEAVTEIKGVMSERLLDPPRIQDTARKVEALALAPTDAAKLRDVNTSIDSRKSAMDAELALKITRRLLQGWIRNDSLGRGGWLIDQYLTLSTVGIEHFSGKVIDGVAGLIPEVGGFVAAVCTFVLDKFMEYGVKEPLKLVLVASLDTMIDGGIDLALAAIRSPDGAAKLREAKAKAGPFATIMDEGFQRVMMNTVDPHVRATREGLDAYDRSVKNLAAAAAKR